MSFPFFILGLPRSRSAWLADLLDCAHEMDGLDSVAFFARMDKGLEAGNADSSQIFKIAEILRRYPYARFVFINRDVGDAAVSFCKVSKLPEREIGHLFADIFERCQEWRKKLCHAKEFAFSDLDKRDLLESLWDFCRPGQPFPEGRCRRLLRFNVQQKTSLIQEAAGTL